MQYTYRRVTLFFFLSLFLFWGGFVQGNFLTINSEPETMSRNSGVFWAMLQTSMLLGNSVVYIEFRWGEGGGGAGLLGTWIIWLKKVLGIYSSSHHRGLKDISAAARSTLVATLLSVCGVGVVVMGLLRFVFDQVRFFFSFLPFPVQAYPLGAGGRQREKLPLDLAFETRGGARHAGASCQEVRGGGGQ